MSKFLIFDILKAAKEMDTDPIFAMNCRRRFLSGKLWETESNIARWINYDWNDNFDVALFVCSMKYLMAYKKRLSKEISIIDKLIFEQKDAITDEMIERARSTPIETILDFTRGKIRCIDPDHDDKHPSAYYGSKTNRLVCPVCNKTWDAIACYQYAFSCDFKSAVKSLS